VEDTSAEQKVEHHEHQAASAPAQHHEHTEHQHHEEKKGFNFMRWLKGGSRQEFKENASYTVIFAGAIMVGVGLALGTAIKYAIYVGAFGGLFVLAGMGIYIVSQLMAPVKGTGEASA
jgi:hypothetical protein